MYITGLEYVYRVRADFAFDIFVIESLYTVVVPRITLVRSVQE